MKNKLNVLVITQYFPPENALISVDVTDELTKSGHKVRVITGYPNYPAGKIFPGYKQKWRKYESFGQAQVLRVPLFIDHSQNFFRRVANYASFGISVASARKFGKNADVIYVYATQMTAAIGPWIWRITGGSPYVLHVQDLWPDSIVGSSLATGGLKSKIISRVLDPWILDVYKRSSYVIGIAPTMVKTLVKRGVDPEKVELIYNWPSGSAQGSKTVETKSIRQNTHILYAGNIGEMQDLGTAIRAAVNTSVYGVKLTLIGDGIAKKDLMKLAKELEATNVVFMDRVSRSEMQLYYDQADFGLVTLKDLPVFRGTVPSKFQAVLAHGLPVITSVEGDVSALTELHQVGFTAKAESLQSLEVTFRRAAEYSELERTEMARCARLTAKSLFSKEASNTRIRSLLQSAVDKENNSND